MSDRQLFYLALAALAVAMWWKSRRGTTGAPAQPVGSVTTPALNCQVTPWGLDCSPGASSQTASPL